MPFVGNQKIQRIRRMGGSYDSDGKWAPASSVTTTIDATVNPIPGDVSTERGLEKRIRIISETGLRAADEENGIEADQVVYFGKTFRVYDVQHYPEVIPHYESRAVWRKAGS